MRGERIEEDELECVDCISRLKRRWLEKKREEMMVDEREKKREEMMVVDDDDGVIEIKEEGDSIDDEEESGEIPTQLEEEVEMVNHETENDKMVNGETDQKIVDDEDKFISSQLSDWLNELSLIYPSTTISSTMSSSHQNGEMVDGEMKRYDDDMIDLCLSEEEEDEEMVDDERVKYDQNMKNNNHNQPSPISSSHFTNQPTITIKKNKKKNEMRSIDDYITSHLSQLTISSPSHFIQKLVEKRITCQIFHPTSHLIGERER